MSNLVGALLALAILIHAAVTLYAGLEGNGRYQVAFAPGNPPVRLDTLTGRLASFTEKQDRRLSRPKDFYEWAKQP